MTRLTHDASPHGLAVTGPDGGDLLGQIDSDGTPRDAPTAAHAPRSVELVPPGRQLVGEPLPVPGRRACPHRPAVEKGVLDVEARGPSAPALHRTGQVGHVVHVAAETGGAHQRAVPTGQAALSHLVPAGVVDVPVEPVSYTHLTLPTKRIV